MATTTLFPAYVKNYFSGIATKLVEKINGKDEQPVYLFRAWFKKQFQPTLKYETLMASGSISAADVVATDSKLPLKQRDVLSSATGDIPKIGMKMQLREGEMNNIDIMLAQNTAGAYTQRILTLIFGDVAKVVNGFYARLELMALQALSLGYFSLTDANNTGKLAVVTMSIPTANQFGAATVWSNTASTPINDIESIQAAAVAKGHKLAYIFMDRTTFNQLKKTTQVKERYAAYLNLAGTTLITPTLEKVNNMLKEDLDLTIVIVESYVNTEKNGIKTNTAAWAAGRVAFTTTMEIGTLHYGTTAEERRPVAGVAYTKADDYMLISKFSENEPLAEFTAVQGYAIPTLNDPDKIYQLNAASTSW